MGKTNTLVNDAKIDHFHKQIEKVRKAYVDQAKKAALDNPLPYDLIELLEAKFREATHGTWQKGDTSHQTVAIKGDKPYHVANWHHGDDADFAETAHRLTPYMINEIEALRRELAEKNTLIEKLQNSKPDNQQ